MQTTHLILHGLPVPAPLRRVALLLRMPRRARIDALPGIVALPALPQRASA